MNFQNIIAAIIIIGAVGYIALLIYRQTFSFSTKSGCASNCGCNSKPGDANDIH